MLFRLFEQRVTEAELARHHRRLQLGTLRRRMSGIPAPDWPLDLWDSPDANTLQELTQRVAIGGRAIRLVRRLLFSPAASRHGYNHPASAPRAGRCPAGTWQPPVRLPRPATSLLADQPGIAGCSECSLCADCGKYQRWSRLSSRPPRRCRCNAIPRWFGLTVIPNCRDR